MAKNLNNQYSVDKRWQAVVDHSSNILVVNAGPGTGKTFSLLRRLEKLLENGADPSQIYYLTFVNSIVDAFKSDVEKPSEEGGLGKKVEDLGIQVKTLHSLAFKIVNAFKKKLNLSESLELIELSPSASSQMSQIFLNDLYILAKDNIKCSKQEFKKLIKYITACWRNNSTVDDTHKVLDQLIHKLCARYDVMPWDYLVPLANKAIDEYGLPDWLTGTQHFLIDEYQDFNGSEQQLIEHIIDPSDSAVIVGDVDQSIYSGRSASPRGIIDLLAREDIFTVNFTLCRRCPKKVIHAANKMLEMMDPASFSNKELKVFRDVDGHLDITTLKSCKAEVDFIAAKIDEYNKKEITDIIILLPTRKAVDYYGEQLTQRGVICTLKLFDRNELLEACLKLVLHGHRPFIERFLVTAFRNLDRRYCIDVLPVLINKDTSVVDAIKMVSTNKKWRQIVKDELSQYILCLASLTSKTPDEIVKTLKLLNLEVSIETIKKLLEDTQEESSNRALNNAIEEIVTKASVATDKSVHLMTIHSSKGLSKKIIFIPAFEDRWMPGNSQGERLNEMHRLFYVGMTRAKLSVHITFPKTRAQGDPLNYVPGNTSTGISRYTQIIS